MGAAAPLALVRADREERSPARSPSSLLQPKGYLLFNFSLGEIALELPGRLILIKGSWVGA